MTDLKKDISEEENELTLEENNQEISHKKRKKKSKFRSIFKFFSYTTIFLFISLVLFGNRIPISGQDGSFFYKIPFIGQLKHLAESADKKLKGEEEDRINILLLGIGGKGHDGGYLTDTIMLASLQPSTKKVSMLSIPRDLSIPVEGRGWVKINNVNAFAEAREKDSGGVAISQALSDILNIPIDYYLRVDFEAFVNIVDKLDGIDVDVENVLDDYRYPILGEEDNPDYEARFEHLHFDKGEQTMDGITALKYARSRHAIGIEGSDFARARRQQLIIQAAKTKVKETNFILNPTVLPGIISELNDHLSTNLTVWEMLKLWKLFKDTERDKISTKVLDNSPNGLLYDMINERGSYVLLPKNGDFEEIEYLVENIFEDAPIGQRKEVVVENASIEVRNGTWINGLANRKGLDLEKYGFEVIRIGNSSRRNFEKSIIYDLTFGEKIKSLTILKEKTKASVSFDLPQWLKDDIKKDLDDEIDAEIPDFILILGQDADITKSGAMNLEQ